MIGCFYPRLPETITIDRNWSCRPSEPQNAWKKPYLVQPCTVESVTESLARGPFVAIAGVGPHCYSSESIPLSGQIESSPDTIVYGWRSTAARVSERAIPVIVCGVQRREGKEHIYYRLAEDISEDRAVAIGTIRPSATDLRVYVASLKRFSEVEVDMFPPVSPEEIRRKREERVVPTIFANRPDLLESWKRGDLVLTSIRQ